MFEKTISEEKDVGNQFSLLNRLYKDEVENLEYLIQAYIEEREKKKLSGLSLERNKEKVEKLKKELEEKKELIKKLEVKEKVAELKEEIKKLKEQNNQLVAQ